jgi:hypothetical protein
MQLESANRHKLRRELPVQKHGNPWYPDFPEITAIYLLAENSYPKDTAI